MLKLQTPTTTLFLIHSTVVGYCYTVIFHYYFDNFI